MSGIIISPDGTELGYFKEGNVLYAGFISNTGCSKEWELEYDDSFSLDQNLEALCDLITETWND